VRCSHPLSASTHKTARTGGHNARKQSSSSKMQESRFSSMNVQSARERLNPQATSAPGHVIVAQGSATPESGCTLTDSHTDDNIDNRSVDLDGAVHGCRLSYYPCSRIEIPAPTAMQLIAVNIGFARYWALGYVPLSTSV